MDRLWAPWRAEYIRSIDKEEGCFLCRAASESDDQKNLILHRGRWNFVILNRYPYNAAHLMVAPFAHTADLLSLTSESRDEMLYLAGKSMEIITRLLKSDGFNCGFNLGRVAGAGLIDHIHFHIVPRWNGDTNFLPVIGETKCISEHIQRTYEELLPAFSKI